MSERNPEDTGLWADYEAECALKELAGDDAAQDMLAFHITLAEEVLAGEIGIEATQRETDLIYAIVRPLVFEVMRLHRKINRLSTQINARLRRDRKVRDPYDASQGGPNIQLGED
jgi:hypothetical protein